MRTHHLLLSLALLVTLAVSFGHAAEPSSIPLLDGNTLTGWKVQGGRAKVARGELRLENRAIVAYEGTGLPGSFDDFEFFTEILTEPGATAEIAFTGTLDLPRDIRVAVNNSCDWSDGAARTGSLTQARREHKSIALDGQWFSLRITRHEHKTSVWVKDVLLVEDAFRTGGRLTIRQGTSPAAVCFKNMRIKVLPAAPAPSAQSPAAAPDEAEIRLHALSQAEFPLINYHIHLKGDLTLEKALAHSRETGVFYGIAVNCGFFFPIKSDSGLNEYIKKMEGQPCFVGMQAEGREWPTLFSKEAIAKFDYIFTDAMTIVDHRGKRARLWIPAEVDIPDKQAFMELLVRTIEQILDNEPVDIYANPTYLPDVLINEYDTLWTPERVKRVIDAAARNGVAIEISNRLKLPKADFIRQAKQRGIKFTLGTNNVDSKLGREEYALEMIRACGLTAADMFLPKPDGKKPIQVKGFKRQAKEKDPREK